MSYRFGSVQISKWQLALLIGTPVAIGLGIYVYKKATSRRFTDEPTETKPTNKTRKKMDDTLEKNASVSSINGTAENKELEQKKKSFELESEKLSPLKEATMYKNEGNVCYRNGKFDEAISFYDKAIDKCPKENRTDMAIFYQNRAASYEMLRKWSRVKKDCSRSLEYNPRYAKAYFRRAKAHEATNQMLECLDDVTATCLLELFQNNNTIIYADRVLKKTGRADAERGMRDRVALLPSANFIRTYLRSFISDPVQTVVIPKSALTENPRGFVRAKNALEQENYDDIIPACTEEIESSESEAQYKSEALLLRATFLLLSGQFQDAQSDLDAIINNTDCDDMLRSSALIRRAGLYIQMEQKDQGLADFEHAEKLKPDNIDIYHQRAQIYILLEQLQEALVEFEKTVKMAPNHPMPYVQKCYAEYRLALMSQDQMRLMTVMNEFKNAIVKFPHCVECYSLLAQVLSDQKQFEQSDHFYEKAMKMAPANAPLYVHRGIMLLQWKGDIDTAVSLMNRAIEVDERCGLAYETLGTVEVQRSNLDRAVELFEKAIKLSKSHSEMCHLFALRNAAKSQINVTRKLGLDLSTISALAQSGVLAPTPPPTN